ncbi:NADH pyrophosphatase [Salinivibrio proteolyticus]|uniref:NAD(+) diphosphatase n=1 Tax=Salinivibrio proteolyticus TaxID=334715 RepID=UPI0009894470|nr:NAD(+) diphosphatase [Salinivibrio proteolyticus]OOF22791.1 NADH pyrophosphatase [Salinivibrio proteolyticus]
MSQNQQAVYLCAIVDGKLWLPQGTLPLLPLSELPFTVRTTITVGHYQHIPVVGAWNCNTMLPSDEMAGLRALLSDLPADLFALVGRVVQLDVMQKQQAFCGRCGHRAALDTQSVAMWCAVCQRHDYPRVSPCVIVAVRDDKRLLLAQHPRHKTGMYTVIAGFVEPGETLEQCVAREVKEETGIEVKDIRYMDSQPWAFPSNVMMGFLADYAGGQLRPDYEELTDAQWFDCQSLPPVAPQGTIARRLIDASCTLAQE